MEHDAVHELTAAYALAALDGEDERRYAEHLPTCARCREELAELSETATALAYAVEAPEPPPALRGRILDGARAERTNVVPFRRRWVLPATGAAALAAACAAVGFGIWAASLHRSLTQERNAARERAGALTVLADPAARHIPLSGAQGTLVVGRAGAAALVVSRLDPPPAGKTYEAWVIESGKPRPAGLFGGGRQALAVALARPVPRDATVAVTVERSGGAGAPTGTPLFSARA